MIPAAVIVKKITINRSRITFFKITASGKLKAAVAIMKASAVPSGIPFLNKAMAIGTIAAQLPYMGTPNIVAKGTDSGPVLLIIS